MLRRLGLATLLAVTASGCLSGTWQRDTRWKPVPADAIAALQPGSTDLTATLAGLGAPLDAYETSWLGERASVLAWGWYAESDWGFSISVPIGGDGPSPSFSMQSVGAKTRGLLLFFDADWTLLAVRTGLLRDLLETAPRSRPSLPPARSEEVPR